MRRPGDALHLQLPGDSSARVAASLEMVVTAKVDRLEKSLGEMSRLLAKAEDRLAQYRGMCRCPGVDCVTDCAECDKTQALVNEIRGAIL